MENINIVDISFKHSDAPSSGLYIKRGNIKWVRNGLDYNKPIVFTDHSIPNHIIYNSNKKIAWLLESPLFIKHIGDYVLNNKHHFKCIFTCSKSILENTNNSFLLPIGGCWIEQQDFSLYQFGKTKKVSIIASNKNFLIGHQLRHYVISLYQDKMDLYGSGYKLINKKIEALKDYKASVVIENCKEDYYFTEKLIDCFVTGTLPIYWGCPSIGDFFDINGILVIEKMDDLEYYLKNVDELYKERYESIKKNFELAMNYIFIEDNFLKLYNETK